MSDQPSPAMSRQAVFARGARFFLADGGAEMFEFVIDGSSKLGPYEATDKERIGYADAYARFLEPPVEESSPLQPVVTVTGAGLETGESETDPAARAAAFGDLDAAQATALAEVMDHGDAAEGQDGAQDAQGAAAKADRKGAK